METRIYNHIYIYYIYGIIYIYILYMLTPDESHILNIYIYIYITHSLKSLFDGGVRSA